MPTALIADDQPYIRATVEQVLREEGFNAIAHANDGVQALALARKLRPRLIVLEIALPLLDGIEVIQRVRGVGFPVHMLVLTSYPPEYGAERCLKAGASGFLCKTNTPEEFRNAVRTINAGFIFFPNVRGNQNGPGLSDAGERERIAGLSAREIAVLRYLAVGFNNIQIGEALLLSNKTVSAYKSRLVAKLKVKSVVGLAELARRHQLI